MKAMAQGQTQKKNSTTLLMLAWILLSVMVGAIAFGVWSLTESAKAAPGSPGAEASRQALFALKSFSFPLLASLTCLILTKCEDEVWKMFRREVIAPIATFMLTADFVINEAAGKVQDSLLIAVFALITTVIWLGAVRCVVEAVPVLARRVSNRFSGVAGSRSVRAHSAPGDGVSSEINQGCLCCAPACPAGGGRLATPEEAEINLATAKESHRALCGLSNALQALGAAQEVHAEDLLQAAKSAERLDQKHRAVNALCRQCRGIGQMIEMS